VASTVVTGGSRGLGLQIVKALFAKRKRVVVLSRNPTEEFKTYVASSQGLISYRIVDFASADAIAPITKEVIAEHGPIDALVNNAAVGTNGILTTLSRDTIESTITVNLLAPILLAREVSRHMLAQGHGRIVNVSSINAFTGYNGLSVYAATKAGLIGFTKSLARELGKANITVNAVAPGLLETDLTSSLSENHLDTIRRRSPLNRFATLTEAANAIMFLLSDEASGMTGTVITVDAGNSA
jgi:3-oxoacyl-[acyl-carrier protein] reductase